MSRLFDPANVLLDCPISSHAAKSLSKLAAICNANSLHFSATAVLRGAATTIEITGTRFPDANIFIREDLIAFKSALNELVDQAVPDVSQIGGFTSNKHPALGMLTNVWNETNTDIKETVGNLIVVALLTECPLPKNRSQRLLTLLNALKKEPHLSSSQVQELQILQTRSRQDLLEVISLCVSRKERTHMRFNATLLIHLRSGLNSQHEEEQRSANLRQFFDKEESRDQVQKLKDLANVGDPTALITLLAFSLGLQFELTSQIPVLPGEQQAGLLAWLDVTEGAVRVSTDLLLRELGQPIHGAKLTKNVYRLILPTFLADRLRILRFESPHISTLGELLNRADSNSSGLKEYWSASRKGKLIRSAALLSLEKMKNRVTTAYGFLAFHLLTLPDLHYLHIDQAQIDHLRQQVLAEVGLPIAGLKTELENSGIGSKRTATQQTIVTVFNDLDAAVNEVPLGKRYSLASLVKYHNRYTQRVAMFLQLTAGGRNVSAIEFLACSWFAGSLFGFLNDKSVGAAGGKTPIPITPLMCEQLRLWERHLESLEHRLQKLLGHKARETVRRIQQVRARGETCILFLLREDGSCKDLLAEDLFSGHLAPLNRDWGRHAVASALVQQDAPLAQVHRFLRHQGGAVNPQSSSSTDVPHDHLLVLARRIDLFLESLPLAPLPGLGGRAK